MPNTWSKERRYGSRHESCVCVRPGLGPEAAAAWIQPSPDGTQANQTCSSEIRDKKHTSSHSQVSTGGCSFLQGALVVPLSLKGLKGSLLPIVILL